METDGVLASWAVPKGPSLNTKEKRLAVRTEDHPLSYAEFEGTIPEGEYGAGTVMVWDFGTYENVTAKDNEILDMKKGLEQGHVRFILKGKKLHGAFAMTRMRKGKTEQWLLVKMDDEYASERENLVGSQPESVKTGRDLKEIESEGREDSK